MPRGIPNKAKKRRPAKRNDFEPLPRQYRPPATMPTNAPPDVKGSVVDSHNSQLTHALSRIDTFNQRVRQIGDSLLGSAPTPPQSGASVTPNNAQALVSTLHGALDELSSSIDRLF